MLLIPANIKIMNKKKALIHLHNLSFAYPHAKKNALNGIDCKIFTHESFEADAFAKFKAPFFVRGLTPSNVTAWASSKHGSAHVRKENGELILTYYGTKQGGDEITLTVANPGNVVYTKKIRVNVGKPKK